MFANQKLKSLTKILEHQFENIVELLSHYQPYEVTVSEIHGAIETLSTVDKRPY